MHQQDGQDHDVVALVEGKSEVVLVQEEDRDHDDIDVADADDQRGVLQNAAEHGSAVLMAMKNRMDLAVTIATGSGTQIALFVAPVLVFASFLLGHPMSLVFNAFEIVGVALSVLALSLVSLDGESNWFEGLQLVAIYVVLAIVFYFVPAA